MLIDGATLNVCALCSLSFSADSPQHKTNIIEFLDFLSICFFSARMGRDCWNISITLVFEFPLLFTLLFWYSKELQLI